MVQCSNFNWTEAAAEEKIEYHSLSELCIRLLEVK